MNRRTFLKAIAAGSLAGSLGLTGHLGAASANRPNIVLIVADDIGFSDIGCYGSKIEMPDKVAAMVAVYEKWQAR